MNEWRDRGVVLRCGQFRERDKWVKILCRERGALLVFAFGASVSKKRFCGCIDSFNTLDFLADESRFGEYVNMREARLLEGPRRLRKDWARMGLAANCMLFLEAMEVGPESAVASFELLENLRQTLEDKNNLPALISRFFRLRLASALGFAPNFSSCATCGEPARGDAFFLADEGRFICGKCLASARINKFIVPADGHIFRALDRVASTMPDTWEDGDLSTRQARLAARVIDGFTAYHLGLVWDKGRFARA